MKKVLALVAVIALMASVSLANETLHVWTELVSATPIYHSGNLSGFTYGTTPIVPSTAMPLGYYGVQVWAEVLGGTEGGGIQSMSVTLYTPDTTGVFNPVAVAGTGGSGIPPNVYMSKNGSDAQYDGYSYTTPAYQYFSNPALNPTNDIDSIQLGIGLSARATDTNQYGDLGVYGPTWIATEAWNLTSLNSPITVAVSVGPSSAYFTGAGTGQNAIFDSVVGDSLLIPEPITMTMLGLGIFGLGGYIRRRVKVAA